MMFISSRPRLLSLFFALAVSTVAGAETGAEKAQREMAEIQRLLNAQVMARPFGVEEMSKIDAYIAEAMKRKVDPEPYRGVQPWRRGMTCTHLHGYFARRNCRYYYSYYGHYYPY